MRSAAALPSLLLCILHFTAGASAKPRYMVLFPLVLYYPHPGKVHIHLMDLEEPVRVTLHLESSHGIPDVTLEAQGNGILQLNWPRFSKISTPPAGIDEVAHVHVSIQGGSLQVSEHRIVVVKSLEPGIFVQTDKDVYKPGQTGEGQELLGGLVASWSKIPESGSQIPDPWRNHVAQWQKVSPRQGIVDLSFPLAANATLGMYTIEVMEKTHLFEVKDYRLPRFEVLIQLPHVMMVKDKIPLDVCGWYPSGKPFWGRAETMLCQQNTFLDGSEICVESSGQTGKNGCFSTEVPASFFNLTGLHSTGLCAQALLLEEGTHEHSHANSQPVLAVMATLQLNCSSQFRVSISAPQGELKDDPPASEHEGKKYLNYQSVHSYLHPTSLNNENFLKIRRVEKKLPCGQPLKLWVDYLFDEKAIGIGPQSMDVVFLVS
ncbi:A2ML1 protein, partial [Thinocorus orbignyianus]|nr:A2ML1 protein [Thinocorus orbignyianus]